MHKSVLILASVAMAAALSACGSDTAAPENADQPPAPAPKPLSDEERLVVLASLPAPYNAGDLENGRRVFARCRSCHTITPNGPNMTGPNLYNLFGSEVGTKAKYRYSNPLKEADFVWDAATLDDWLKRPADFLPGNKMSFVGIAGEQDRRDVIAYLKVETGYATTEAQ